MHHSWQMTNPSQQWNEKETTSALCLQTIPKYLFDASLKGTIPASQLTKFVSKGADVKQLRGFESWPSLDTPSTK